MLTTIGHINAVFPCTFAALVGAPAQIEAVHTTSTQAVQISDATAEFARALTFGALRARLGRWSQLQADWDGADGVAPAAATVNAAQAFLTAAERAGVKLPAIYIAGDGEVGFRWDRGIDAFASVSFLADGHVVAFARSLGSDPFRLDVPVQGADLKPLLTRLRATV